MLSTNLVDMLVELSICAWDTWLIALEAAVSSGFDVVMRKLSKMSNKSGDDCCCSPFPPLPFRRSSTDDDAVAFFLSFSSFRSTSCCCCCRRRLEPPSSSNAVSIVCLSTWIWPLWEPFVLILHTLKQRNTQSYKTETKVVAQCLKITRNVAFEFFILAFSPPILVLLKLACLALLFDRNLQFSKTRPINHF